MFDFVNKYQHMDYCILFWGEVSRNSLSSCLHEIQSHPNWLQISPDLINSFRWSAFQQWTWFLWPPLAWAVHDKTSITLPLLLTLCVVLDLNWHSLLAPPIGRMPTGILFFPTGRPWITSLLLKDSHPLRHLIDLHMRCFISSVALNNVRAVASRLKHSYSYCVTQQQRTQLATKTWK